MSRESRIFSPSVMSTQNTVTHYESFGWELLSINGDQIAMTRETQNPVYPDLVKFQSEYEETEQEYMRLQAPVAPKAPPSISIGTCLVTLLLFVVPCVAYVAYKINQKNKYNEALEAYNDAMEQYKARKKALLDKMEETARQSRAVFFSRKG